MGNSKIEWTEKTWNCLVGCTPVSPGCLNCYAATMARRLEAMGRKEYAPREEPLTGPELRAAHASVGGGKLHDHERVKEIRIAEVKNGRAVFTGDVRTVPDRLTDPLKWRKPVRVFVNSMSDLFHEAVPFEFIDQVFAVMALCPHHTFQVLTKRPERMAEYLAVRGPDPSYISNAANQIGDGRDRPYFALDGGMWYLNVWPLPNVWLGTSVERQTEADERIPHLLECPAAVRFISAEPLLSPISLGCGEARDPNSEQPLGTQVGCMHCENEGPLPIKGHHLHWVIVGGESGPGARPCDVAWIRGIVGQCKAAGVPVFVKQLGAHVVSRNDEVSDWLDACGISLDDVDTRGVVMQGDRVRVRLKDRKGGTMEEWPEDLRVREFPEVKADDATTTPRL